MNIGEKIRIRRKELKLSQRDLAEKMGYSHHSTLGRIEQGKVDVSQTRIAQFAEVLGVSIAYLMDWEEVQKNNDTIADIIGRMQSDSDFLSVVEMLCQLDAEKLGDVKKVLAILFK